MYFQRANNVAPNFQPQRCFKIIADQRSIEKTLLLKRANPSSTGEIGGQKRGRRQLCGDVPRQRLPGPEREQRWRIGRVAAKVLDSRTSMTSGGKAKKKSPHRSFGALCDNLWSSSRLLSIGHIVVPGEIFHITKDKLESEGPLCTTDARYVKMMSHVHERADEGCRRGRSCASRPSLAPTSAANAHIVKFVEIIKRFFYVPSDGSWSAG